MPLTTLKPRLSTLSTARAPMLEAKAGSTQMERGRAWMAKRERVALAHGYRCAGCSLAWRAAQDQIDHIIPRERGGSNDESNLQPLCDACHKAKTADETKARFKA
jgi:5-methylcytosine-specific restriction protein A